MDESYTGSIALSNYIIFAIIDAFYVGVEDPSVLTLLLHPHMSDLIDVCVIGPILEEWIFRGLLESVMRQGRINKM